MNIYPDTSFVIASRVGCDTFHDEALDFYEKKELDSWLWSPWHRIEVFNSLRQFSLGHKPVVSSAEAKQVISKLNSDVRLGYFVHVEQDWREVLRAAQEISAAHAFQIPCRSADLLHVAYAKICGADLFVSFDDDQVELAKAAGLESINPAI